MEIRLDFSHKGEPDPERERICRSLGEVAAEMAGSLTYEEELELSRETVAELRANFASEAACEEALRAVMGPADEKERAEEVVSWFFNPALEPSAEERAGGAKAGRWQEE